MRPDAPRLPPLRRSGYPEIKSFVERSEKTLPKGAFKVVYKYGSSPTLVLKGDKGVGVTPHRIRIERWKTDAITDYLRGKLALAV